MNTLLTLSTHIHLSRRLILAVMHSHEHEAITELIAALCLHGPLYVVAGSDWLPSYSLARLLRHKTHAVKETLQHVHTARAFTCYQLLDLVASIRPDDEPLLILDFLNTFHNDDIPLPVRFRLLRQCCLYLQRLAFHKPVAVIVQERDVEDYAAFYDILAHCADEVLRHESEPERVCQPALL